MKATAVITFDTCTDADGQIFEKTCRLVNISVSEEFFDDFNNIVKDKSVKIHFEKEV